MSQPGIAARTAGLEPTAVNQVLREVRQVQAQGQAPVSLMRGQPDTPTPGPITEAAVRALHAGRTGYPDNRGEPGLRAAVADKLARENDLAADPAREILITAGATEGLAAALAALVGPGDEVLLPDPVYDAYASAVLLWGARPVGVPSRIESGRFTLDRPALERAGSPRARLLLLNTPWNPTGTVFTRAELEGVMEFAESRDLWVL